MGLQILAVLTDAATTAVCLEAAVIATSNQQGAVLRALYVDVDPNQIITAAEEIDFQMLRDVKEGSATTRRRLVEGAFETWRATHLTVAVTLTIRVGEEQTVLIDEASGADLIVLAHARNLDNVDAFHAAAFSLSTPILLIPAEWHPRPWKRIAIAWSGSEAAEHAVAGALPWLARADAVSVLTIGERVPTRQMETDLGLAGINLISEYRSRDSSTLGEQLVAVAHEIGSDALVAGAYRHNAVIEWLVGGTTRHLLNHADLPLFLSH